MTSAKIRGVMPDRHSLGVVVATKAGLLALGALVAARLSPSPGWLGVWDRWDTFHYLAAAREGYSWAPGTRSRIVFLPLYPALVRVVHTYGTSYLVAALVVSGLASLAAALVFRRLVELDEPEAVSGRAVRLLYLFPTAYFLHIGYAESLFLALVLGSFYCARRGRWPAAGALGALACATRLSGLLLIPALAVEAWEEHRQGLWNPARTVWIALTSAGLALYLAINQTVAGSPFAFLAVQRDHFGKSLAWPWTGLGKTVGYVLARGGPLDPFHASQELLFAAVGLAATAWCVARSRPSYALWCAGNWVLATATTFVQSVPRYTLALFPLFILLGRLGRRRSWDLVLTTVSAAGLVFYATLFALGHFAF